MIFCCLDTMTMLFGAGEEEIPLRRGKRVVHGPPHASALARLSSDEQKAYKAAVNTALYARPLVNPEFATAEWVVCAFVVFCFVFFNFNHVFLFLLLFLLVPCLP